MNTVTEGLKKLVASFDANQRAIIKGIVHECLAKYTGHVPGFVLSWINGVVDKSLDRFLDDTT